MNKMRHKLVYIAGPFRGPDHWAIAQNIRRAEEIALKIWAAGFTALCPHLNTAHFQGVLPDSVWLEGDLEILKRCDLVVVVPGWQNSQGATAERKLALIMGLPVIDGSVSGDVITDLNDWAEDQWYTRMIEETRKRTGPTPWLEH